MYTHRGVRTRTRSRAEGLKPSALLGSGVAGNGSEQCALILVPWGGTAPFLGTPIPGHPNAAVWAVPVWWGQGRGWGQGQGWGQNLLIQGTAAPRSRAEGRGHISQPWIEALEQPGHPRALPCPPWVPPPAPRGHRGVTARTEPGWWDRARPRLGGTAQSHVPGAELMIDETETESCRRPALAGAGRTKGRGREASALRCWHPAHLIRPCLSFREVELAQPRSVPKVSRHGGTEPGGKSQKKKIKKKNGG